MQTLLAAGDNPRIIKKIAIFNAGGVVRPRPSTAHDYLPLFLHLRPPHGYLALLLHLRPPHGYLALLLHLRPLHT
ncbi:MAG: hypothetical protein HDS99_02825, partial [Bacteroidales bacterium]|nr:hypothetical protein [Bacteroidales bacterium]